MKAFTDINQSKKLAEILPIESADHHYVRKVCDYMGNAVDGEWSWPKYGNVNSKYANYIVMNFTSYEKIPCWSLATLLDVIKEQGLVDLRFLQSTYDNRDNQLTNVWWCTFENLGIVSLDLYADNPVDTCVAMIKKLHELKML